MVSALRNDRSLLLIQYARGDARGVALLHAPSGESRAMRELCFGIDSMPTEASPTPLPVNVEATRKPSASRRSEPHTDALPR
jgi:hypothetical protein